MALLTFVRDTSTGVTRGVAYPGFVENTETVAGSAKSTFDCPADIDAQHHIDAYIDGRLQAVATWTRDVTNNQITFDAAVDVGRVVRIRVFLK